MQLFFTIHDADGKRIDDDSDYPFAAAKLADELASLGAEPTTLGDGQPAWVLATPAGPQYIRTVGVEG